MLARLGTPLAALLLALAMLSTSCSSKSGGGGNNYVTSPAPQLELNSGDIAPGGTYVHRFAAAGTYGYHCIHHAPMTGNVQVGAGAADTLVNVSITSDTSPFPAASVKPGGTVVWTNNSAMLHTVTSN